MPWLFVSYVIVQVLFAIVHIVVDASFRCSNVTLVLDCKKKTLIMYKLIYYSFS
jgi:hypothetical protein